MTSLNESAALGESVQMDHQGGLRWNAVFFDLDGTLIDTRPGMLAALTAALAEVTGDPIDAELADLSLPLEAMIRSARPAAPPRLVKSLSLAFRRQYDSGYWKTASLYPGAEACLRDLDDHGLRTFVVTNKRRTAAARLLEHFNLSPYLDGVVGQEEGGPPLPKAALARRCLVSEALDPASTVVVGDSDQDEAMAASWAMPFIALVSGAGPLSHASVASERVELETLTDVATCLLHGTFGRNQ